MPDLPTPAQARMVAAELAVCEALLTVRRAQADDADLWARIKAADPDGGPSPSPFVYVPVAEAQDAVRASRDRVRAAKAALDASVAALETLKGVIDGMELSIALDITGDLEHPQTRDLAEHLCRVLRDAVSGMAANTPGTSATLTDPTEIRDTRESRRFNAAEPFQALSPGRKVVLHGRVVITAAPAPDVPATT